MSTNPFEVVGELVYDSEHDELYVQETIYDDDLYWLNQREADDYRHELDDECSWCDDPEHLAEDELYLEADYDAYDDCPWEAQ